MRKTLYNMSGGRGYQPGDTSKTQVTEKVFSVKTRRGNYAVERFVDSSNTVRYRLMHDRRYITPETFFHENRAIAALLEHVRRVFVQQQSIDEFVDDELTLLDD